MSLKIIRLEVGQMKANCYILAHKPSPQAIIIDPGDDAGYVIQTLEENELIPTALLATHGHLDHTMAALELKLAYNIPFYMHKSDEFLLKRMRKTAKHFLGFDPGPPPKVDFYFSKNSTLQMGEVDIKVIETPGHTPGSVCFYIEAENTLIGGDLMFEEGQVGRVDFAYSNKADFLASLGKVQSLPTDTMIYAGHGASFRLGSFGTKEGSEGGGLR